MSDAQQALEGAKAIEARWEVRQLSRLLGNMWGGAQHYEEGMEHRMKSQLQNWPLIPDVAGDEILKQSA